MAQARLIAPALRGLIVFQALLGMWTVALDLARLLVTAHLTEGIGMPALQAHHRRRG